MYEVPYFSCPLSLKTSIKDNKLMNYHCLKQSNKQCKRKISNNKERHLSTAYFQVKLFFCVRE